MFEKLAVVPAYRVVCDAIEKEILAGRLGPGEQLPTETDLSEQFGLTRHTVREGLRILEEGGLVGREAGRRLFVKRPHYAESAPRVLRTLVMQQVTFLELWDVSMALEPVAAELAARVVSRDQIVRLDENLSKMSDALDHGKSIIDLDVEFHTQIAEIAGNKALLLAREPISQLFYPALSRLFEHPANRETGPRRLLHAHQKIVDGLRLRDEVGASAWMRRHIADFRRGYDLCGFNLSDPVALNGLG